MKPPSRLNLGPLCRQIAKAFILDELKMLCTDLRVDYEETAGENANKSTRILGVLTHLEQEGRLKELLTWLKKERQNIDWEMPTAQTKQGRSDRRAFLNNVQAVWIDGYLKNSLSHTIKLELNLTYDPSAVSRKTLYTPGKTEQIVDKPLQEVFEDYGRSLLILGDPGSGKTITLLELAENLLAEARNDYTQPIPVVLNLSSWGQAQKPLTDWLVEEIFLQYQVARNLTHIWIKENQLLYLLDGLDEVTESARDACIAAINEFKGQHPADLVVCSRTADYKKLRQRLNVGTAVHLHSLSKNQIDNYLAQEGLTLQTVRVTLRLDPDLQELARSPLFLSLITLAYQGLSVDELKPLASIEARRQHLFDHYIQAMFDRRPLSPNSPYTQTQALNWLTHLASSLKQQSQSSFYIEHLQSTWLSNDTLRYHYAVITGQIYGFVVFLTIGLIAELISKLNFGFSTGFSSLLIFGLPVGFILGRHIIQETYKNPIKLTEQIGWIPFTIGDLVREIRLPLFSALMIFLLGTLLGKPIWGFLAGLISGLFFGVPIVLETFLLTSERKHHLFPNQGIRNSFYNAVVMGSVFGAVMGLLSGLQGVLLSGWLGRLSGSLVSGLSLGFFKYGGISLIQHYTLRWMLAREGILPYPFQDHRLIAFLDAMRDRILLRRVGGGWIFIHRVLLEYFASRKVTANFEKGR